MNGAAAAALKNLMAVPSKQPGTAGAYDNGGIQYDKIDGMIVIGDFDQCKTTYLEALLVYWRRLNGSTGSIPCLMGMGFLESFGAPTDLDFPYSGARSLRSCSRHCRKGRETGAASGIYNLVSGC